MATKRPSVVAAGLLARPGEAPARSTPLEELPQPTSMGPNPVPPPTPGRGIKQSTIGTTVYLLPREHKRVRRLALDLDVPSVHELLLMGLYRLLAEQGEPPIERYSPPRPKKF